MGRRRREEPRAEDGAGPVAARRQPFSRLRRAFRRREDPLDAILLEAVVDPRPTPTGDAVAAESPSLDHSEVDRTSTPEPPITWPAGRSGDLAAPPVVIGEPSTFGASDWWRSGWWPLTATGDARDVQADLGTVGDLAIAGVACRGHKHRLEGSRCDDAFHIRSARSVDDVYAVIAVCDGVGSAPSSALGAQRLSRTVTHLIARNLADHTEATATLVRDAVRDAVASVIAWADREGHRPTDLETTLTIAVVPAAPGTTSDATIAWIGDSPAFVGSGAAWREVTGSGADEVVASSATRGALTARPDELRVHQSPLAPGERLLLCTDGVGAFIGSGDRILALGEHLSQTLAAPVDLATLVHEATFDLRSADDDRTMVLTWKAPVQGSPDQ